MFKSGVTNRCLRKELPKTILRVIAPILMSESHRENGKITLAPYFFAEARIESHRENGKSVNNPLAKSVISSESHRENGKKLMNSWLLLKTTPLNLIERTESYPPQATV